MRTKHIIALAIAVAVGFAVIIVALGAFVDPKAEPPPPPATTTVVIDGQEVTCLVLYEKRYTRGSADVHYKPIDQECDWEDARPTEED